MSDFKSVRDNLLVRSQALKEAAAQLFALADQTRKEILEVETALARMMADETPYLHAVNPAAPVREQDLKVGQLYIIAGMRNIDSIRFDPRVNLGTIKDLIDEQALYPFDAGGFLSAKAKHDDYQLKRPGSFALIKKFLQ